MAAWGRGKGEHHGGHKERAGRTDHRLRYFPSTFGGAVFCVRRPVASTVRTPGQRRERCTAGGAIALPSLCRFRTAHYTCIVRVQVCSLSLVTHIPHSTFHTTVAHLRRG